VGGLKSHKSGKVGKIEKSVKHLQYSLQYFLIDSLQGIWKMGVSFVTSTHNN